MFCCTFRVWTERILLAWNVFMIQGYNSVGFDHCVEVLEVGSELLGIIVVFSLIIPIVCVVHG